MVAVSQDACAEPNIARGLIGETSRSEKIAVRPPAPYLPEAGSLLLTPALRFSTAHISSRIAQPSLKRYS